MRVAIRTDASLDIGNGHVMRCLTLADALKVQGADCHFICRVHSGHMLELIRLRGHCVTALPIGQLSPAMASGPESQPVHAALLGCDWQTDAEQMVSMLVDLQPDWLVVDHYALDQRWEAALSPHYRKLLVIDDLADRPHRCDLLLDQNLGRQPLDYEGLVPTHCQVLTGSQYALLRPEFAALRPYSLQRRLAQPALRQLLISMGGVDQPNATGQVLQALKTCTLPADCRITVAMGLAAPWLQNVQELAAQMPWPTEVVVNVSDMAQRMADSDLAIGAAGSTSWERCCLGLPTLMVVLAENQRYIAAALDRAGAAMTLEFTNDERFAAKLKDFVLNLFGNQTSFCGLCLAAARVTDGKGTDLVVDQLIDELTL
jgi:UDP-2,4-diacetamido-2,4,6-trideoxy-beta-L-altropyranose hydrolase